MLLLLVPEAVELGEAVAEGYELYRAARAAQALARAARIARQLEQAAQAANTVLSRTEVKGCETCPKVAIPCFNTPANGTDAEMRRQLKEQQDAINKMSPDQLLNNLKNSRDPVTGNIVRPPGDAST